MRGIGATGIRGLIVTVAILAAAPGDATPRYSMKVGQQCNLCHHNPSGGGLRSLYASQYLLPTRLAMVVKPESELETMNPRIGENVVAMCDPNEQRAEATSRRLGPVRYSVLVN